MSDGPLYQSGVRQVRADAPQQFRVGADFDGQRATGGLSYDRKWSNLWGFTAYAKAYWTDQPVIPTDRFGYAVGFDVSKTFGEPK